MESCECLGDSQAFHMGVFRKQGYVPLLGVLIRRILLFRVLLGSPIFGNSHINRDLSNCERQNPQLRSLDCRQTLNTTLNSPFVDLEFWGVAFSGRRFDRVVMWGGFVAQMA